ncbi:MAG: DUF3306 domain-containing protein [Candidatus Thiodiazotropha sp.]
MKPEDSPQTRVQDSQGFYRRWSEKKQASQQVVVEQEAAIDEEQQPGDEDMPPLESLTEESDYSGFLSPKVSEQLRQLALGKLFHSAAFNVCDGLDDYAEDFTSFEKLGDVMTADLRHRLEQEALKKQAEADELAQAQAQATKKDDDPIEQNRMQEADEEASLGSASSRTGQQEDTSDEVET